MGEWIDEQNEWINHGLLDGLTDGRFDTIDCMFDTELLLQSFHHYFCL